MTILVENGKELLEAASLTQGTWGDGVDMVCMMSAFVPGAKSVEDCATAGWPQWMTEICIELFDAFVDVNDETQEAINWAFKIAEVIAQDIDYKNAHRRFVVGLLEAVVDYDPNNAVRNILDLYKGLLKDITPSDENWAGAFDYAAKIEEESENSDTSTHSAVCVVTALDDPDFSMCLSATIEAVTWSKFYEYKPLPIGNKRMREFQAEPYNSFRNLLLAALRDSVLEN